MRKIKEKVCSRAEAVKICKKLKAEGKKIGYSSGTFDLLHPGHTLYLETAREQCDFLILGLNSDKSVRSYKSLARPVQPEEDRLLVFSGSGSG